MENKKQHSPNWNQYVDKAEEFYKNRQSIPGFPFTEKFPRMYGGQEYELILSNGEKCKARVNDEKEFSSEGLEWQLLSHTQDYSPGQNIERYGVVAWREI
jgi:hypothetical protein